MPLAEQMRSIDFLAASLDELSTTTSDNPGEWICQALVKASMTQGVLKAMVKQTLDNPDFCNWRENSRPRLAPLA